MRLTLTTLLLLLVVAAPAMAAKRPRCDVRPGATLASDGVHRVYVRVVVSKKDGDDSDVTVYSCTVGSRKRSFVLEGVHNTIDGGQFPVGSSPMTGRWFLLHDSEETGTDAGESLQVFDLRTGKAKGGFYEDGAAFTKLVLTRRGAFAYQQQDDPSLTGYDSAGSHDLAPKATALAAGGAFVYWRNPDKTAGSFELGGPPRKFSS